MAKYMLKSNDNLILWIDSAPGEFNVRDIEPDFEKRFILERRFEKLVEIGYIERVGKRRGWYRKIESQVNSLILSMLLTSLLMSGFLLGFQIMCSYILVILPYSLEVRTVARRLFS